MNNHNSAIKEIQIESRPGTKGYFIGAGIFLLGMISHIIIWVWLFAALFSEMQRFKMPASHEIHLKPGQYTLYHEYDSLYEEEVFSTDDLDMSGYSWTLRQPDSQNSINLNPNSSITYQINWFGIYRNGRSVFTFVVSQEGDYRLAANSPGNIPAEHFIISIKKSFLPTFINSAVLTLLISIPLYLMGVIIVWRTFLKRLKAKRLAAGT